MDRLRKVILLLNAAREYERSLIRGIMEYSHVHGPWTFYEDPPDFLERPSVASRVAHMRAWKADGLISSPDRMREIRGLALPTITTLKDKELPAPWRQIVAEDEAIGRMAAEHLIGLGLTHFAFCGIGGMAWSEGRKDGFTKAVSRTGQEVLVHELATALPGTTWYSTEKTIGKWIAAAPKPIGVMACNDDMARLLAEICRSRGVRIPDDVALVGVDNDELVCGCATPPLSSVALTIQQAGYEAAALLDALIAGGKSKNARRQMVIRPTHVVVRQSTDMIGVKDENLVKAIRFIRKNASSAILVRDVAAAAGLSRRVLQDRFKHAVSRPVSEEVVRSRVQRISRLLVETNQSIAEISLSMGYPVNAHIARFFKRHTGMTPLAYRRAHRKM